MDGEKGVEVAFREPEGIGGLELYEVDDGLKGADAEFRSVVDGIKGAEDAFSEGVEDMIRFLGQSRIDRCFGKTKFVENKTVSLTFSRKTNRRHEVSIPNKRGMRYVKPTLCFSLF